MVLDMEDTLISASAANLTERELAVLHLLSRGLSNRQAAAALMLSESTVKLHVAGIFRKLGVASRTEAVALAIRHGIVSLDSNPPDRG
jgi:DNA-binding NarL/FixJ family response regulator